MYFPFPKHSLRASFTFASALEVSSKIMHRRTLFRIDSAFYSLLRPVEEKRFIGFKGLFPNLGFQFVEPFDFAEDKGIEPFLAGFVELEFLQGFDSPHGADADFQKRGNSLLG